MTEDLNTRVQNAAKGITPQTRPDERRQYLGSLRERVLVRMDNSEIKNSKLTKLFLEHLLDFKNYQILLNGKVNNSSFFDKLSTGCSQNNIPFTLVTNETAKIGPEDTAVLVVSKTAINRKQIKINQVYPPEIPKQRLVHTKKKIGFWQRLFHGDK